MWPHLAHPLMVVQPNDSQTVCAGLQRLFDLVKCSDAALRPAFFYALGDTVVAQDLEQASRIAYGRDKRWARVVTVQVRA